MNQEESEHNEVDGMKKGVDSKGEVMYDLVFLRIDSRAINYVLLTWSVYQRAVRYVTKYRDKKYS